MFIFAFAGLVEIIVPCLFISYLLLRAFVNFCLWLGSPSPKSMYNAQGYIDPKYYHLFPPSDIFSRLSKEMNESREQEELLRKAQRKSWPWQK